MKKINIIFLVSLILCFCLISLSAELNIPKLNSRVVDKTGVLSSSEKAQIEAAIQSLEADTGGQMAVLIIPSLKGEPIEEFSIKVADRWKIGYKDKDNGAILLISQKDKKIRLEVGDGWEGFVNDARAGDIIRSMKPFFRNSEFTKGIIYAIGSVHKHITGKTPAYAPPIPKRKSQTLSQNLFAIIFFLIFIFAVISIFRGVIYSPSGITFYRGGYRSYGGGYRSGGGWSSGGGGFSGGGFSGGGGGFSGGGASGGW